MSRHIKKLAFLSAGLAVLLLVLWTQREPPGLERATLLPSPLALPSFALLDEDGANFGPASLEGQWSLMFFGFTHCPDICPVTLQQLAAARRQMAESLPEAELPSIVFVSVDPNRDTIESIKAYVRAFGSGVRGVTGPLPELNKLTGTLGIFHQREEVQDGHYAVDHSSAVVVINSRGQYHAVFSAPHAVESLARDTLLMMSSS